MVLLLLRQLVVNVSQSWPQRPVLKSIARVHDDVFEFIDLLSHELFDSPHDGSPKLQ